MDLRGGHKYTSLYLSFQDINVLLVAMVCLCLVVGVQGGGKFIVYLSRVVRKPEFCICENKDADQLRGNRKADQRLCFRYTDSKIALLPISKISSL